jgi:hypothetical protein
LDEEDRLGCTTRERKTFYAAATFCKCWIQFSSLGGDEN